MKLGRLLWGLTVLGVGCGSGSGSNNSGGTPPGAPSGLAATAGNQQVGLTWDASSGARHKIVPADVACDDTAGAYTVTVTFGAAQAGRLVLVAAK